MAAPDVTLVVKRKKEIAPRPNEHGELVPQKPVWLKCGTVNLWFDKDGTTSGKLQMNVFDSEFHLFQNDPKEHD